MQLNHIPARWLAICAVCRDTNKALDMLDVRMPGERVDTYVRLLMAQREPWYPAWGK